MPRARRRLYVAYGSNMNLGQMAHRCPTAKVIGTAWLRNYRLLFRGGNGGAVATVERFHGGKVPLLVWELQPRDEDALDRYEGWPSFYRKESVRIRLEGKQVRAMVYIMNDGHPLGLPGGYYFNVIREGYISAGFDTEILRDAVKNSTRKRGEMQMTSTIREQILAVRETRETNMFDVAAVQGIANREGFYELVCYLEDHRREYSRFILTGKAGEDEWGG